jgi:hypothetical protein
MGGSAVTWFSGRYQRPHSRWYAWGHLRSLPGCGEPVMAESQVGDIPQSAEIVMPRRVKWTLSSPDLVASRGTGRTKPRTISARCSLLMTTPTPSDNTVYPSTVCICASICMMCCCPASRANFSVTYAHVAVHPQEQVGRLTSRLPNFSGQIVMLWVTLMIVMLPSNGTLTLNRPKFPFSRRKVYL